MVSVVSSPARVDIKIETRNVIEVSPASVIVTRTIPVAVPEAPPPAVMEKQIHVYTRNSVDVRRVGQHYHRRGRLKYDGWRQGNPHTHTYLGNCRKRNKDRYRQKECSKNQPLHFEPPRVPDGDLL
jgi:hypothetical protein